MQVLEIKNNLVKIAYDVKDNLALSQFVIIEDANNPYVAQVVNVKADATTNFAIVKLLFTFNDEGILKNYNGTIPSLKSVLSILPSKELLDIIPVDEPLVMGELAQQDTTLKVDKTILDNNLLICSNNMENTNIFVSNITKQLKDKVVIFDTDGQFQADEKFVFGRDFKLPLNYDTLNFVYDNDLEDVDATSKAIIQDIFIEVQEYTKTLPEGYLPFETFLNVVDQQYKETQITQLVLLKNKLLKYRDLNVFAENLKDFLNLSIAIDKSDKVVIDISNMPDKLQKLIMTYAYKVMNTVKSDIYSFVKIENGNSDKKLLKNLISRTNVNTIVICSHEYKYIKELKENAQNLVLFAPLTLQHDFANYNSFLNKLNSDEFIIYGAHTQNIPFIVELEDLEDEDEVEDEVENVDDDLNDNDIDEQGQMGQITEENTVASSLNEIEETPIMDEAVEIAETPAQEVPEVEYPEIDLEDVQPDNGEVEPLDELSIEENEPVIEETIDEEPEIMESVQEVENSTIENSELDETIMEEPVLNTDVEEPFIEENVQNDDTKIYNILDDNENIEIEEPDIDYSLDDSDIEVDYQEPLTTQYDNDAMIEQAAKDVDKLIYEKLPEEDVTLEDLSDLQSDELTEDDLNLIGDLTYENNSEISNSIQEQDINDEEQPPIVPIYEANDIEDSPQQSFEPGDHVSTPKFGEGVVEKMIKYGNKMLCSIDFPHIGRRLLDPAMTEITKL